MKYLKIALIFFTLVLSGSIHAAPITTLEITGGTFSMAGANNNVLHPGAYANMTVGGYDGSSAPTGGSEAAYYPYSIATFQFGFFGPVGVYTAPTNWITGDHAPVTGDITGTVLTLDLSSWTMLHCCISYDQGSSSDLVAGSKCVTTSGATSCTTPIVTTYDATTGTFTAAWSAVVIGNAFNGQLGSWYITGNVSAVPVPAALWLFGSGLIALLGLARRKNNLLIC